MNWINIKDKKPDHKQKVIILVGKSDIQVAIFYKGKTSEEVAKSRMICFGDQEDTNLVPYRWSSDSGPMTWFGQDVTYWMPLPELPSKY